MANEHKDYVVIQNKLLKNNIVKEVDSFHHTKEDAARHAYRKNIEDNMNTYHVHLTNNALHDSSIKGWPVKNYQPANNYSKIDLNTHQGSFKINFTDNSPEHESNMFENELKQKYPKSDIVRHSDTRFSMVSPNGKKTANIETKDNQHSVEINEHKYDVKHILRRDDYKPDNT